MTSDTLHKLLQQKLHGAHDYSHIERVLNYGKKINAVNKGNWKIIEAALLLHEITKNDLESIKEYLPDFTEQEIESVTYCISKHHNFKDKPTSLEGKIVQDSDILDMLGATGIARGFMASGERGLGLTQAKDEYKKKRLMVIDQLNLEESKKIAEKKISLTKLFFTAIEEEMRIF